jgi:hypothetical protein
MSELRYEMKMICLEHQLTQARSWIKLHPAGFLTAYAPRRVNNIYLDTPAYYSLSANLAGVSSREKLRLRWYGDSTRQIQPWLELKVKQGLLGTKRRSQLPCTVDLTQSWINLLRTIRVHAPDEWRRWLEQAAQPSLFNWYEREYYVTPDGAVRATLDFAQHAYDQRLSPRPNLRHTLPLSRQVVIELKSAPDQIERLQEIIGEFPIPRSRSSKYVNGLRTALFTQ